MASFSVNDNNSCASELADKYGTHFQIWDWMEGVEKYFFHSTQTWKCSPFIYKCLL